MCVCIDYFKKTHNMHAFPSHDLNFTSHQTTDPSHRISNFTKTFKKIRIYIFSYPANFQTDPVSSVFTPSRPLPHCPTKKLPVASLPPSNSVNKFAFLPPSARAYNY